MSNDTWRRWGIALAAGLVACGVLGSAAANAQTGPIIIPPISTIVVSIPPRIPSLVGIPGAGGVHRTEGVTWSKSGRADVDIDVDRQHGQTVAR